MSSGNWRTSCQGLNVLKSGLVEPLLQLWHGWIIASRNLQVVLMIYLCPIGDTDMDIDFVVHVMPLI